MKKSMFFVLAIMGLICSFNTTAAPPNCTVSPKTINYTNNIVVARDLPIGSQIEGIAPTSYSKIYECGATSILDPNYKKLVAIKAYGVDSGMRINNRKIYKSSLAGVGYAVGGDVESVSNMNCTPSKVSVFVGENTSAGGGENVSKICETTEGARASLSVSANPSVYFYKIGDITAGKMDLFQAGAFAMKYINVSTSAAEWNNEVPIMVSISSLSTIACTVDSPQLNFPMGNVSIGEFKGVGSNSSTTVTQNLGLQCELGGINIKVSLDGMPDSDVKDNSVLALTDTGNPGIASGVGIQLLYGEGDNQKPLVINEQLTLKKSLGGQETFPLTARYYQTKDKVVGGKADAVATLTITYE